LIASRQPMPHLFVDISSHGFGHLAQAAPVINRLTAMLPNLHLTLRSGLPEARIRQRLAAGITFDFIPTASDFGFVMLDALRIDFAATAAAYRTASADFLKNADADTRMLTQGGVDCVLSDIAFVPLAAATRAGIPAVAMCSLNWADLFAYYFGHEPWAATIHAEMLAAYRGATFLRTTPGMPMPALADIFTIGPLAAQGRERRHELRQRLGIAPHTRVVLVALGGIPLRLPVESWPKLPDTHWLIPAAWRAASPDFSAIEALDWPFVDLLCSIDAVVTKPGYGTFAEAACNGTPVLYQRREDWPEQDCLIDWLHTNTRCTEVDEGTLQAGDLGPALARLLAAPAMQAPAPTGIAEAAEFIAQRLGGFTGSATSRRD